MQKIEIKQLLPEDWPILKALRLNALQSDPHVFGSNYAKESQKTETDWRDWLESKSSAVFVLFDADKTIGLTGIALMKDDPTNKTAILWGSWLEPTYRGQGLSSLMYDARLAWAKNHPTCEKIIVSHRESNLASKHANQKHGFIFTHKTEKIWPDGKTENDCFYELLLKK